MKVSAPVIFMVLFFLISTAVRTHSQVHNSFQGRSFQASGVSMVYRLFVPKNYVANQKYPILVAMHGVGEKGNDNNIQVDREDLGSTWIEDSLQTRVPHFVMVPQCPTDLSWGSSSAIHTVHQILDSLRKEFTLDTNRFYVAGLSMGARGTFNLLSARPGRFAAALACAGAGDTSSAGDIAKTPIWAFHATGDAIVNVSGTRDMITAIEKRGPKFLRFVSQAPIQSPSLTSYSDAIRNGTSAIDLVAKAPTGISYDSLRRAVAGGSQYLYSEIMGGDHRTGWMIPFHHPLVTGWIYAKVKGNPSVSLGSKPIQFPQNRIVSSFSFSNQMQLGLIHNPTNGRVFSLQGRYFKPSKVDRTFPSKW